MLHGVVREVVADCDGLRKSDCASVDGCEWRKKPENRCAVAAYAMTTMGGWVQKRQQD